MRYVYLFHEGNARMKELLGGKGANLAEMTNIGLPVPCGMTITTDACREYYNNGKKLPEGLVEEVTRNLKAIEAEAGKRFGDEDDPLLLSVRSGAVFSMPGMMDTILNLGLNAATFKALARHTGNMWFACDTYRRFIQMFSDVVMEIPKDKFEHILQEQKAAQGVTQDQELSVESLLAVIDKSKALYRQEIEEDFPEDVTRQLFLSIEAVFRSWNNHRAIVYRNLNKIDHNLGTAVNIQAMVFGNMGEDSGSGVAFSRNPSTGERKLYGEYLINAQGEDVVVLMGSRDIPGAIRWVREQAASGVDVSTVVEKGKSAFIGPELYKKTLGIIGLGAIGSIVANTAISLGMDVYGYDPFLSVDTALRLDRHVHVVKDINDLYKRSNYITMHIHYTEKTAHMIDASAIAAMKRGVRVINLARGEIVDDEAMLTALDTGMVAAYITDFPNNRLLTAPHVIAMPHLGASTPESEQNCAAMAVDTLRDYLESGNIRSSVNLPEMTMDRSGVQRLCVLHKNVPGMLANITSLFGRDGVNVENLSNKSRGDYAYTMVDLGSKVGDNVIEDVRRTANVIRVRSLEW